MDTSVGPTERCEDEAAEADGLAEDDLIDEEGWWPEEPPELCDDREFLYPDEAWSRDP